MVQVPRFPSVDLQPMRMPEVQAPRVQPMEDQTPRQIAAGAEAVSQLASAGIRYGMYEQRVEERMRNQLDDARTNEAFSQIYDFSVDQMSNKDTGYEHRVGKAAQEAYQPTRESIAKKTKEIENSLQNDVQKQMFRMKAGRYLTGVYASMDSHYQKQVKIYDISQAEVLAQNYGETALRSYKLSLNEQDPQKKAQFEKDYQDFKGGMVGQINRIADINNVPAQDPLRASAIKQATDLLHGNVVQSLIDDNRPADALRYLEKYRSEMSEDMGSKAQASVTRASINDQATRVALPLRGTDMSLKQRNDALVSMFESNKIPAEVLAQARNIVAYDFNLEKDEKERTQSQALQEGMNWVLANPGKPLSLAPPQVQQQVLENDVLGKVNKAIEAQNDLNNSKAMFEVRSMANSDEGLKALRDMTPEQFALKYMPQMNSQDFSYAKSLHAAARGEATPEQQRLHSLEDRVLLGAVEAGVISKMPGKDAQLSSKEKLALTRWQKDFSNKIATQTTATGKAPTDAEIQNMIDQEVILRTTKVQLDQFGFDPERVLSEIVGDEQLMQNAYVRNRDGSIYYISQARKLQPGELGLTEQVMDQLKKELQAQGLAQSPTNAIWLWLKQQGQEPK